MKFRKNKSEDRYDDKYDRDEDRTLTEDILDFVKVFAISAIAILLFVNIVAHPVTVMGRSMDPTLANGEYGFTNLLDLAINGVNRGDVVVLDMEEVDGNRSYWVKRVIGLPGETIECKNGQVYIDGVALDESAYLDEQFMEDSLKDYVDTFGYEYETGHFTSDFEPVTLGEDEYWVMGDNRMYSKDSRYPDVGPVKLEDIYGKGVLVLWPLNKIGVK